MKILLISERTCIRTLKQAIALSQHNEVHLVTKKVPKTQVFASITCYDGSEQSLAKVLPLYDFVDIVDVHAEPHWILVVVRRMLPRKKIVLNIHDSMIWRSDKPEDRSSEERLVQGWADAWVVPSKPCLDMLKPTIPAIALPPYVPEELYQMRSWGWKGGIVYQGRVDMPDAPDFMDYCKMYDTFKGIMDNDIPVNLYTPAGLDSELKKLYDEVSIWQGQFAYGPLLSAMGFHDWGLCGNIKEYKDWNLAMPNKLFDYLAGGIPVIALNAKEVGKFVEKHGFGISVSSVKEIKDRWDERDQCQRNVMLKRYDWTMEKHICRLEDLYKEVLS